jgi:hypothetical protein
LSAPQFMHVRGAPPGFAQPSPLAQLPPAQHVWPLAPQGSHAIPPSLAWHDRLALHALAPPPPQQASPWLPQAVQVPPVQSAPEAVQVICPNPPPPRPPAPIAPPQQV